LASEFNKTGWLTQFGMPLGYSSPLNEGRGEGEGLDNGLPPSPVSSPHTYGGRNFKSDRQYATRFFAEFTLSVSVTVRFFASLRMTKLERISVATDAGEILHIFIESGHGGFIPGKTN